MTRSIEKLQKKLDKDPNSLIFVQLAEEHRKQGNLDSAVGILKGGLSRHPNYWSARVTLGRIYLQMGRSAPAKEELEKVVLAVPDNLLANRLLGDIYITMQLPGEALKRYRIVQMMTPADQDLAAQIRRLESEVVEPEPQPEFHAQTEPQPEPQVMEPEYSVPQPAVATDEAEEEGYAPTVQIQIPSFFEKTEVPIHPVEDHFAETLSDEKALAATQLVPENAPEEQVDKPVLAPLDAPLSATEEPPFLPDTLTIEAPVETFVEEPEPEPEQTEDQLQQGDSDELTSLASLLLSTEKGPGEPSEFDELETELVEDPEMEVEEFMHDPQQDRTQPIMGSEEEVEEADELTTETLAELYLNQGFVDKAVKVYQRLLLNDPGNTQIRQRLKDLNSEDSSHLESESAYREEEVLVAEPEQPARMETPGTDDVTRRAEERRRKINTLENWLTTIRRERD